MKRLIFTILCCIPLLASADDSSKPLIVLDGMPMLDYTIDSIDKDNIAKVTILKTDIATKIYGEQGKYGVIVVTSRDYLSQSGDSAWTNTTTTDSESSQTKSNQEDQITAKQAVWIILFIVLFFICVTFLPPVILLLYDRRRGQQVSPAPLYVRFGENLWDSIALQILQLWISALYLIGELTNSFLPVPQFQYFSLFFYLFCLTCYIAVFFFYYYICEYKWGKTLGKKICRTIVVNEDGTKPTRNAIAIRTLCRLIPFDSISFLFSDVDENGNMTRMWHDILSHTRVIRTTTSTPQDT